MAGDKDLRTLGEVVQFKIVEKEVEVEVPKYVEKIVEIPKYVEKVYEKPIIKEVDYEKPVLREKDLTTGLQVIIKQEVEKCLAEVIQSLKISMEIPMSRVLQVRPGGKKEEVG